MAIVKLILGCEQGNISIYQVGTEGGNPTPPPSPPPPPSYKLSRRRAQVNDGINYSRIVCRQFSGIFRDLFLLQQLRSQPGTPVDGGSPRGEEGVQVRKFKFIFTKTRMCSEKGHWCR